MITRYNKYLQKHTSLAQGLEIKHATCADIIVVIPVYLEDNLEATLSSLINTERASMQIAVYLVVNAKQGASEDILNQQEDIYQYLIKFAAQHTGITFIPIRAFELPVKHFGAGLARKIGMDEAIRHFNAFNNENGVILSLDADSLVEENYFSSVSKFFKDDKKIGCSINFEHPLNEELYGSELVEAITQYELHLRYYVEALKYINFPYAFHTVGSCFAVKADAYVKVGGMNRRQGGEEFYFIQKIVQVGEYGNINDTTVYPSPRISNRVPFGTGPTVKRIVEDEEEYLSYNLQAFIDLKVLFDSSEKYYKIDADQYQAEILNLPGRVRSYLLNSDFFSELDNLNRNCSNVTTFTKRFFQIFSAFSIVKYINYTHEHFIEKVPVSDAALDLLELLEYDAGDIFDTEEILHFYKKLHKGLV
ncbi:glycosyltransferase [Saccharicrinis aurantiacus]|uniref:glycosyltransferase n=1 Tax=Saccharicrinis aurantiacus TaxID=1849719 RepID=UPI0024926274|nr:glycosyltransferase family 2 protein [Saccharicrinis aurantiacus]